MAPEEETDSDVCRLANGVCVCGGGGGDRGAGDREKRGREVYGRREKSRREPGFPRWREAEEKGKKIMQPCAIFRNRKNAKGREPKNTGREPGLKGTGSGRFKPPCPPPNGNRSSIMMAVATIIITKVSSLKGKRMTRMFTIYGHHGRQE